MADLYRQGPVALWTGLECHCRIELLATGPALAPTVTQHGEYRGPAPYTRPLEKHYGEVELPDVRSEAGNALLDHKSGFEKWLIGTAGNNIDHGGHLCGTRNLKRFRSGVSCPWPETVMHINTKVTRHAEVIYMHAGRPAKCPFCGSYRSTLKGRRTNKAGVVRIRKCKQCGRRWTPKAKQYHLKEGRKASHASSCSPT